VAIFRLGLHFASVTYPGVPPGGLFARISAVAAAAEQNGFDFLSVPDHALQNAIGGGPEAPMPEAYTLLGALAATTGRARLGTLVSPVTFRYPSLLAKAVTTLDVISGGRAVLSLGAGWDAGEHAAYGVPFPGLGERQDRLEEAAQLCRAMLRGSPTTFEGRYYAVTAALNSPAPLQPSVPVLVGGGGERRTLRTVARHADVANFSGDPDTLRHKLSVLRAHCEQAGRDPADITTTAALIPPEAAGDLRERVSGCLEAGVDGVILLAKDCPGPDTAAAWGQALAPLGLGR
jgi:F420-dependent oxidoreductase-like protein